MNLPMFVQILARGWWVGAVVLAAVVGSTAYFTFTQTPIYRATATVLVGPEKKIEQTKDVVGVLRALDSRKTIATFAKVPGSHKIRKKVSEKLTLTPKQMRAYRIRARVTPDTNIIKVTVEHTDPRMAAEMANTVAKETKYYLEYLYTIFDVNLVDAATAPSRPVRPLVSRNLSAATLLGLLLGVGAGFVFGGLGLGRRSGVSKPGPEPRQRTAARG